MKKFLHKKQTYNVAENPKRDLPNWCPATPAADAVCGYIAGVGPFYTRTKVDKILDTSGDPSNMQTDVQNDNIIQTDVEHDIQMDVEHEEEPQVTAPFVTYKSKSETLDLHHNKKRRPRVTIKDDLKESRKKNLQASLWKFLSLATLFLSSGLFLVSFTTNSWGYVVVNSNADEDGIKWNFGLWMCCRGDGLCLGLRWPAFYSVARVFTILSLFGHALSFAWMLGHTLEKLLTYDMCTMSSLISICFLTAIFTTIAVSSFGSSWTDYFQKTFVKISVIHLNYSFYMAVVTIPLMTMAGIFALIDLKGSWKIEELKTRFKRT